MKAWSLEAFALALAASASAAAHLPGRDRHRSVHGVRPDEPAPLQPFHEQTAALAVMPDHLHQVTSAASEDKQVTAVRVLADALLNHQRQAGPPLAHVPLRVAQAAYFGESALAFRFKPPTVSVISPTLLMGLVGERRRDPWFSPYAGIAGRAKRHDDDEGSVDFWSAARTRRMDSPVSSIRSAR